MLLLIIYKLYIYDYSIKPSALQYFDAKGVEISLGMW